MMKDKKYNGLITASSPRMLGYMRKYMSAALRSKVDKEIDKDLVNDDMLEVQKKLFA